MPDYSKVELIHKTTRGKKQLSELYLYKTQQDWDPSLMLKINHVMSIQCAKHLGSSYVKFALVGGYATASFQVDGYEVPRMFLEFPGGEAYFSLSKNVLLEIFSEVCRSRNAEVSAMEFGEELEELFQGGKKTRSRKHRSRSRKHH